jgi:MHS family proline/betaine transporter-like MFS transporter
MGSWASVGSVAGALLGSGVGALINTILPADAVSAWGWRIPFLLGLGVAGTAVWLRRSLPEIELPEPEEGEAPPVVAAIRDRLGMIVRTVGILMVYAVGYYVCFLYLTSFLIEKVKVPAYEALDINTIAMAAMMLLIPAMAKLSDRVGRKPVLLGAALGLILLSHPLIRLMHVDHWLPLLSSQLVFAVLIAAYAAANPAAMVESFPGKVRVSAMSISFNISFAVFGGTMPMVAAWLLERTHDDYSIAWLLVAAGVVTFGSLLGHPETAGQRFSKLFPDDPEPVPQPAD